MYKLKSEMDSNELMNSFSFSNHKSKQNKHENENDILSSVSVAYCEYVWFLVTAD